MTHLLLWHNINMKFEMKPLCTRKISVGGWVCGWARQMSSVDKQSTQLFNLKRNEQNETLFCEIKKKSIISCLEIGGRGGVGVRVGWDGGGGGGGGGDVISRLSSLDMHYGTIISGTVCFRESGAIRWMIATYFIAHKSNYRRAQLDELRLGGDPSTSWKVKPFSSQVFFDGSNVFKWTTTRLGSGN